MADDSDLEKTEPASPRRLDKAREEGQAARSRELVTFLMLLAGLGALWLGAARIYGGLHALFTGTLGFDRQMAFDAYTMWAVIKQGAWQALITMLPIFGLLAVVAVLASTLLGGFIFASKALQPDIARLSPLKGLKRMVSANTVVELFKTVLKALLVGSVAATTLYYNLDDMLTLMHQPSRAALGQALHLVAICCAFIVASLVIIAGIDAPYQVWEHARKLRMTREDVRQDNKESDGDPHLKARIRQQQRAMSRGRMMAAVPDADVVITNPTHYAVALRYEETTMTAPKVVAKGAGQIALTIRALAQQHRVPLLEAAPLARALYQHVQLDQEIPADLYAVVAEVLAWVYQLRRWRAGDAAMPSLPGKLSVPDRFSRKTA